MIVKSITGTFIKKDEKEKSWLWRSEAACKALVIIAYAIGGFINGIQLRLTDSTHIPLRKDPIPLDWDSSSEQILLAAIEHSSGHGTQWASLDLFSHPDLCNNLKSFDSPGIWYLVYPGLSRKWPMMDKMTTPLPKRSTAATVHCYSTVCSHCTPHTSCRRRVASAHIYSQMRPWKVEWIRFSPPSARMRLVTCETLGAWIIHCGLSEMFRTSRHTSGSCCHQTSPVPVHARSLYSLHHFPRSFPEEERLEVEYDANFEPFFVNVTCHHRPKLPSFTQICEIFAAAAKQRQRHHFHETLIIMPQFVSNALLPPVNNDVSPRVLNPAHLSSFLPSSQQTIKCNWSMAHYYLCF